MKKTTKIICLLIIAVLSLSFVFGVSASALSEDEVAVITEDALASEDGAENEDGNNLFESIFASVKNYAAEILSALAFIGSVIIMLCYKKGLMPLINDGLRALSSGVKTINEKSASFNEHAIAVCDGIDDRLKRAEAMAEAVLKSTELIEKRLSELKAEGSERKKLSIILSSQIDMLYEIFMSASLPQYLKDSVGEKIAEMKAALGKEENNEPVV